MNKNKAKGLMEACFFVTSPSTFLGLSRMVERCFFFWRWDESCLYLRHMLVNLLKVNGLAPR
jgi:hypothetical protein